MSYFYPRSPCGERPISWKSPSGWNRISIHALLAESDQSCDQFGTGHWISIHALLAESDLYDTYAKVLRVNISIHALLAESDSPCCGWLEVIYYFYPRSPCGERRLVGMDGMNNHIISIHALLAESDSKSAQNSGALLRI